MPTTNHAITVTLNGTDRTSLLLKDSLYIRSSVSNDGDTAQFALRGSSYVPNGWHTVGIAINGTTVFGGYIVTKQAKGVGDGVNKEARWAVTCSDWSILLDQTIVNYGYAESNDDDIISDLFTRYLSADGFDVSSHVANVDSATIYFENVTMRAALHQLADLCGADWHIAPDKSLYWYATNSPANAAFDIDTVSPNGSTTFDVLRDSVDVSTDETQIINQVSVIGGDLLLPGTAEVFGANGVRSRFALSQKPLSIDYVTYSIGGTSYYKRSQDIGIAPGDMLRYEGGEFDVVANLENRIITIRNDAGSVPAISTGVVVRYYPTEAAGTVLNSTASQGEYGRTFAYTVYDEKLSTAELAADYGRRLLDEYAFGRETIAFSVTEHGLLPGRLITLNLPVLDVEPTTTDRLETEARDNLLQEDDDFLLLESSGTARTFLIQEVEIYPVHTGNAGEYMMIARVRAGKYIPTIFDTLKSINGTSAAPGLTPAKRQVGKLSNIANDLGEVVAGRGVFTDGGTASFDWSNYGAHTGVVLGLEDNSGNGQGAMYVLDGGTVRAKIGRINGLGSVGTVAPNGWGIWTSNGYFTGTITGAYVTGGTVEGAGGSIALTPSRLTFIVGSAFSYGTPTLQQWQGTAGGTVAQVAAVTSGGTVDYYTVVGTSGQSASRQWYRSYGTVGGASGDYGEMTIQNNVWAYSMVRNSINIGAQLQVGAGSVVAGGSVYPATTGIYSLGGSANAWDALWLQAPNGTKYKVTVSNAGALVVT